SATVRADLPPLPAGAQRKGRHHEETAAVAVFAASPVSAAAGAAGAASPTGLRLTQPKPQLGEERPGLRPFPVGADAEPLVPTAGFVYLTCVIAALCLWQENEDEDEQQASPRETGRRVLRVRREDARQSRRSDAGARARLHRPLRGQ